MNQVRYLGVSDPHKAFEELKPLQRRLIRMMTQCRPFGPDYLILSAAKTALDTAAYHFTRDPNFYAAKPPG
jgi:hypothetical protein